jgi:hypothetical protein
VAVEGSRRYAEAMDGAPIPDLHAWLAAHPRDDAELALRGPEVRALAAELARLRQSNEMLRKQNRKIRNRLDRLRAQPGSDVHEEDLER